MNMLDHGGMTMQYQVTGNEYLSLPMIRETDGAVESITFLMMQLKGMLDLRGDPGLMCPYLSVSGVRQALHPAWTRATGWIPTLRAKEADVRLQVQYLTPIGQRAMAIRLQVENAGMFQLPVCFGLDGQWDKTLHAINESTELPDGREAYASDWNHMFIWAQKPGVPLFAFAPCIGDAQPFSQIDQGAAWSWDGFAYDIHRSATLAPGESVTLDVFFGVGYEGVGAATSAKELLRQGYDALLTHTQQWLQARTKTLADEHLTAVLNTNLFFCLFYASGRTVDTEELCLMTSRSPRYYVSAAYWDRDSLLWAFPAMLAADAAHAREALAYVFTRQARNVGVHSRYIDGTVLEPGFELDELCAPVIALYRYGRATGDWSLSREPRVQTVLLNIEQQLQGKRHPEVALYETFLQPTDDLRRYPYLTYDNVLVWYTFRALAMLLDAPHLLQRAQAVREAIEQHCVRDEGGKRFYAWSVDLQGQYDVYDEPPGSLQLLPHYGFCAMDDPLWQNTVAMIRDEAYPLSFAGKPIAEIGCQHAPHPWVLSICNSLLSGHAASAKQHLHRTDMDHGIACESVNEFTGVCETGHAFATCAGFLAYALLYQDGQVAD